MSPDYKNILTKSTCLTNSEMTDYLSGILSADKIYKIESHLADCEMCNDELEGLSNLKNLKQLPIFIKSLDNKIDSYFSEKTIAPPIKKTEPKNFSIKKMLSIAASIILLITVGYFINDFANKTSNDLAQAEMPVEINLEEKILANPEFEKSTDVKDNISEIKDDISEIKDEEKSNTTIVNKNSNIEKTANEIVDDITVADNTDEQELEVANNMTTSSDISEVNEDDITVSSEAPSTTLPEKTVADNKKENEVSFLGTRRGIIKTKNKKKASDNYLYLRKSGLLSYDVKSYKDAVIDFDKYLTSKPNDFEIIYKTGMAYFYMDKYNPAISKFNKIISAKNIKYFEDAQWYKATALLNLGKKDDALSLLKQIETAKGKYSKKAKDVISIMNN